MIKGEKVFLIEKVLIGVDAFGVPVYDETRVGVENVLIGQPSTDDVANDLNLYGKQLLFVLGIPKGDQHNWQDTAVIIRGSRFKTYGFPLVQTEANVPGPWNTQVKVARYE